MGGVAEEWPSGSAALGGATWSLWRMSASQSSARRVTSQPERLRVWATTGILCGPASAMDWAIARQMLSASTAFTSK
jgi:hypothetical protein